MSKYIMEDCTDPDPIRSFLDPYGRDFVKTLYGDQSFLDFYDRDFVKTITHYIKNINCYQDDDDDYAIAIDIPMMFSVDIFIFIFIFISEWNN